MGMIRYREVRWGNSLEVRKVSYLLVAVSSLLVGR